ncbi:MAG: phytanoyl-CoA dioxygenase family protein [Stigonema ocellatum SAG 48.90 = DSM 106950]|nr:phytanoyl-CoA dioxygenase family protein [Stigonema ocellatum SAG 48.90 = DSM 106950]
MNNPENILQIESSIRNEIDGTDKMYNLLTTADDIRNYYDENGYVILRNLIPTELCDEARSFFKTEVKPYDAYLYRQASSNPEKHILTSYGYMLNSLLNIQDLNTDRFPNFKKLGLSILTHENMHEAVCTILGESAKIIQTMFFEGNPATWAHQDTYYLDSSELGRMTAAWVAVEDIQPGAGRFYIYPGSHKIDISQNGGDFDIAFNHSRYKQLVLDIINKYQLECRAPNMRKGDVLFWNSKTIHGSLETLQPQYSRSSFTAHYIPASTQHLQYQRQLRARNLKHIGTFQIEHPKDQDKLKNQIILSMEARFPKQFQLLKRLAIKAILK